MSLEQAIEMLKQAKDVHHWNEIRDNIKFQMTNKEWFSKYFFAIDASGLIVEVLGRDQN